MLTSVDRLPLNPVSPLKARGNDIIASPITNSQVQWSFLVHVHIRTQIHTNRSVHTRIWWHTHTVWPHCEAISFSTYTIRGFIRCFTFFRSLCSLSQALWVSADGEEERRVGEETGGWGWGVSFTFLSEFKLRLNSLLPYADLPRNVPYAVKFIKQYWRQTLNETKY